MTRRMKKSWSLTIVALCLLVGVLGCSSNGGNENGSGNTGAPTAGAENGTSSNAGNDPKPQVNLTLAHGWTGEVAMAGAFEPAVDQFIADNSHIKLTVETAPGNGIREKIVTEMAANDPPDVFLHWGVRDTESYIANNKLADLSELIENDPDMQDRYIDNAYASGTYQGKIYGLPIEAYMIVFMVNEQMFEEHGVQIPETFEQLKEAVRQFKAKDLIPIATTSGATRHLVTNLNDQLYGEEARDRVTGIAPFDDRLTQAAQYAKELLDLGAFPEGSETLATLQSLELFNSKQAPMYFQHSWTIGSISEDIIDHVRVIPVPKLDSAEQAYLTSGVGYFVYMSQRAYEDPLKREAAWELAKYLSGPVVGEKLESVSGSPSPVKIADKGEIHPVLKEALELRDSGIVTFPDHNDLLSSEASKAYNDLTKRLYLNDITPEEFATQYSKAITDNPNKAFE